MTRTGPRLVVVTDLDATLLDEETYRYDEAAPALAALREREVPLVLCSSKTRLEMIPLAEALAPGVPFIVENGGAIVGPDVPGLAWPADTRLAGGWREIVLGARREALAPLLRSMSSAAGVPVEPLAEMPVERVAALTGLPVDQARLAQAREFSEPFLTTAGGDALDRLAREAASRGLQLTRGGRFCHLLGPSDKGRAVEVVRTLFTVPGGQPPSVLALGDAPNDLTMLRAATAAVIVPRRNGPDATLAAALPGAGLAPAPGPAGWSAAVLAVLDGKTLPRAGAKRNSTGEELR